MREYTQRDKDKCSDRERGKREGGRRRRERGGGGGERERGGKAERGRERGKGNRGGRQREFAERFFHRGVGWYGGGGLLILREPRSRDTVAPGQCDPDVVRNPLCYLQNTMRPNNTKQTEESKFGPNCITAEETVGKQAIRLTFVYLEAYWDQLPLIQGAV